VWILRCGLCSIFPCADVIDERMSFLTTIVISLSSFAIFVSQPRRDKVEQIHLTMCFYSSARYAVTAFNECSLYADQNL
jgi:hypothetical protein